MVLSSERSGELSVGAEVAVALLVFAPAAGGLALFIYNKATGKGGPPKVSRSALGCE